MDDTISTNVETGLENPNQETELEKTVKIGLSEFDMLAQRPDVIKYLEIQQLLRSIKRCDSNTEDGLEKAMDKLMELKLVLGIH